MKKMDWILNSFTLSQHIEKKELLEFFKHNSIQILNGYKVIFISLISTCINEVFVEDVYQEFEKIVKISLDQEFHVTISSKESYLKVCVFKRNHRYLTMY